jgi:RimJ/RimL family protein N-acetyltransferase
MDGIYLRALSREDLSRIHGWHNDMSLYETLGGAFRFVSAAAEELWLEKAMSYSSEHVSLAICLRDSNEHIGNIYLRNIDWIARNAEVSIFIGASAARGRGFGATAIGLVAEHAFRDLGLCRLYSFILVDNKRSLNVFRKCGFTLEGELIRHAFKGGELKNVVVMGLCGEWRN